MNTWNILQSSDNKVVLQYITYCWWFINGAIWTTAGTKYEKEQEWSCIT